MSEATPKQMLAFGAVGVGLGVVLFALEPRWVPASGTVTAVHVNTTEGRMQGGFRPFVMYTYRVGGREYRADSVWCAPPAIDSRVSRADALADAARIQVGDPVPILYSASSAEESTCLVTSGGSGFYWGGLGAFLIGAFGLFAAAHGWWKARSSTG